MSEFLPTLRPGDVIGVFIRREHNGRPVSVTGTIEGHEHYSREELRTEIEERLGVALRRLDQATPDIWRGLIDFLLSGDQP